MDRIEVEAVEDRSRVEGGYAVILLRGVSSAPATFGFRLRPVEPDGITVDTDGSADAELTAMSVQATGEGLALTIGPEITGSPGLLPGAVVEIVVPDIHVRGEFLWPAVTPQARPKRRNIMTRRVSGDPLPQRVSAEGRPPAARAQPVAVGPASESAVGSVIDAVNSVHESEPAEPALETLRSANANSLRRQVVVTKAVTRPAVAVEPDPAPAVQDSARIETAVVEAIVPHRPMPDLAVRADLEPDPAPSDRDGRAVAIPTVAVPVEPAAELRTDAPPKPPQVPHRMPPLVAAALAVAALACAQFAALRVFDLSVTRRAPTAPVISAVATAAPLGDTKGQASSASEPVAGSRSIYDVLVAGPRSPRGVEAEGVSPAKALQIAHGLLHGPQAERDTQEAIFWLKRYVAATAGAEHARIALTQLGSAYAMPVQGNRDMASARIAWELAGAMGDAVAMCFLGAMHEHGLGVVATRDVAASWYERAAAAGGSCARVSLASPSADR